MSYADSYATGFKTGSQVAENIYPDPIVRQTALQQLQEHKQLNALNSIKLQREEMGMKDLLGAREAVATAQPTITQTPNPSYVSPESYRNQLAAGPPSRAINENVDARDAITYTTPTAGATDAEIMQGYAPQPAMIDKATPPDTTKILRDYWMSKAAPSEALSAAKTQKEFIDVDGALAKQKAEILAGGGDLTAYAQAKNQLDISKEMISTIAPLAAKPSTKEMAGQLLEGYKKAFPNLQIIQDTDIHQFNMTPDGPAIAQRDARGQIIGHYITDPQTGSLKFEKANAGEYAHNVQEITSADGKSAQKFQYNPDTQAYDKPLGPVYPVKSQVMSVTVPKPGRLVQAFDKQTRDLVFVGADDVKADPGRYAPVNAQAKTNQQVTLIEDIRGTINNTMSSLDKLKPLNSAQQAQISLVMKNRDPKSAVSSFLGSKVGQTLSPEQVEYITDLAVLKENILAMRSLLGAGQSSVDQRAAIEATIPSAIHPDKEFAKVQLTKALRTLDRLERGTANASLRPDKGAKIDTSKPVHNGSIQGYRQPDGSIVDAGGKRLN